MKHIREQWNQNIYESAQWKFYFDGLKVGVLDIETTGLNPARNKFVLGCLYDVNNGMMHQILAQSRTEEQEALAAYMELLDQFDVVVTYNGRQFDIPFIERRAGRSVNCYNLDLFQVLNRYSPIKKLVPNMKQKTIENYMGFWDSRADEISGAESVALFNHYEATGDAEAEMKILLHNNDDVRQLTRLTKAITKSDFHRAMFKQGFPVKTGKSLFVAYRIKIGSDTLEIRGVQLKSPINYMGFDLEGWPVISRFESGNEGSQENGIFEIRVPLIKQSGMEIVDLRAAGLEKEDEESDFEAYPMCGSGFLVLEEDGEIKYREVNHFVKAFIRSFVEAAF